MSLLSLFLGTLFIVLACCAVMTLAVGVSGKPLPGGCGKDVPGTARCESCPNRARGKCVGKGETT